ncbi:RNA polymerase epsilon subunit [Streptococcaceae bacterium ESL0687]|nr:RNA polymerase epsilon subunit [Streptococcaceae bacterium ESL0687]
MLFKVFYQETKTRSPKRETTKTLFVELDDVTAQTGIVKTRELLAKNTAYNVEFIDALSKDAEEYEREAENFKITQF